ncbi:hypothetical protein AVEN_109568-1 [Araneus ventricosus]|uniref:Uncharacterized protein n=1 Tax=Araneus ventricosus TaxID=182803 RepID=A0A4Y2IIC8_ARAVE|nr:hypothetical protein AVEN_109568-1 [Araneus ventricosus]
MLISNLYMLANVAMLPSKWCHTISKCCYTTCNGAMLTSQNVAMLTPQLYHAHFQMLLCPPPNVAIQMLPRSLQNKPLRHKMLLHAHLVPLPYHSNSTMPPLQNVSLCSTPNQHHVYLQNVAMFT